MLTSTTILSDRYRLDERLAAGGMGEVWRATDLVLGRTVAIKALLPVMMDDPRFSARFAAEAKMMAALRHPGIVDVYDYGESEIPGGGKVSFLVMELVKGEPLSQRIAGGKRLGVVETMSIVAEAAHALHAAHGKGIVHRDVKPANLLVESDGTVRLVDFGIARSLEATSATAGDMLVGTALYMAPEQASGQPVSAATDVYALGAVAYQCLAGRPPFEGTNALDVALRHIQDDPAPLPDDIPEPVRDLVMRALEKDPEARFASAAEFAAEARMVAEPYDDRPVTEEHRPEWAVPVEPARHAAEPDLRGRSAILAGLGVVVVALAGLTLWFGLPDSTEMDPFFPPLPTVTQGTVVPGTPGPSGSVGPGLPVPTTSAPSPTRPTTPPATKPPTIPPTTPPVEPTVAPTTPPVEPTVEPTTPEPTSGAGIAGVG